MVARKTKPATVNAIVCNDGSNYLRVFKANRTLQEIPSFLRGVSLSQFASCDSASDSGFEVFLRIGNPNVFAAIVFEDKCGFDCLFPEGGVGAILNLRSGFHWCVLLSPPAADPGAGLVVVIE